MTEPLDNGLGESFSDVLANASQGDSAALAALYATYRGRVLAAVRSRLPRSLRSKYDTEDLAQSVFAEVIRGLPRIEDRGERAFVGLLTKRAENKIRDKLRRHLGARGARAEKRLATDADFPAAGGGENSGADALDDLSKLRSVLDGLDASEREIVRLRAEGASFARIASELGLVSADAARKRYARVLSGLRGRCADERR